LPDVQRLAAPGTGSRRALANRHAASRAAGPGTLAAFVVDRGDLDMQNQRDSRPTLGQREAALAPPATTRPPGRLEREAAGWSLMGGAVLFWLSWYLMPQPGTTDAAYILAAVAGQRGSVLASAILQTLFAVTLVPAALAAVRLRPLRGARLFYAGAALLLVGAVGNGADAVYHQIAYEMTAPGAQASAMVPIMTRMQTADVKLLVPLMLAFFAGAVCLAVGLVRARWATSSLWRLYLLAGLVAVAGRIAVAAGGLSARPVSLAVLALVSVAMASTGWALRKSPLLA
jgi:hypothetical protein